MSNQTPQNLKGFRDFLPAEKRKRDFVMQKVVEVFERFGFAPLETPTLEYAALLLGKYGEEADKLVYTFTDNGDRKVGLRYDQTVPTARVLAQYQNDLPKFFRRYQIQNVFRADKPQKGRYREFMQCDIDIFGTTSLISDAEILACTYFAFQNVGYPEIELRVNDRQLLFQTLQKFANENVRVLSIIQTIDKLDKMSEEDVVAELVKKGLTDEIGKTVLESLKKSNMSTNLQQIIDAAIALGVPANVLKFTPNLARGLDYYTGMIFEVMLPNYASGSCGGGGRYDNLIQQLGGPNVPAVGIAFGFDRMVEAANQLNLIPETVSGTKVLVTVFEEKYLSQSLQTTAKFRQAGIPTEVYPTFDKIGKQFKFADQKNIPFVVIIGEEEVAQNKITLKNMKDGTQESFAITDAIKELASN